MKSADHIMPAPASSIVRVVRWTAVLLWAAVIFRFSSLPGSQIPGRFSELGHFGEYAAFGALIYWALRADLDRGRALALAIILASTYGVTDEFHQHFVVMRTPDVVDWGVDTIGAAVGAGFSAWARRLLERVRAVRTGTPD